MKFLKLTSKSKSKSKSKANQKITRSLTAGEIALCETLFKGAVDYAKVKVHNHSYLPFNWQYKNTAMAPNGHIYFVGKHYHADYTGLNIGLQRWFLHEMVHVWQHQLGYPVRLRGAVRIGLSYDYSLQEHLKLADFNMEAQAEMLSDYGVLKQYAGCDRSLSINGYCANDLPRYEKVLALFIYNAKDVNHLPRSMWLRRIQSK